MHITLEVPHSKFKFMQSESLQHLERGQLFPYSRALNSGIKMSSSSSLSYELNYYAFGGGINLATLIVTPFSLKIGYLS
jgi:hypothetical protein